MEEVSELGWFEKGRCPKPGKMVKWYESSCYGIEIDLVTSLLTEAKTRFEIMDMYVCACIEFFVLCFCVYVGWY